MPDVILRIDRIPFRLSVSEDLTELKDRLRRAVTGPAAYVTFRPLGFSEVTALVSPTTEIRFETLEDAAPSYTSSEIRAVSSGVLEWDDGSGFF
jgi:hypothetical protein